MSASPSAASSAPDAEPASRRAALRELAVLFLKLGTIAFGGPAAHIAMMEDEVVRRRRWLPRDQFLDLIAAANLIPGPNSTELALHIGYLRAGGAGLVVAGCCFILPAAIIVMAASWAYVRFGHLPEMGAMLYGVKPVIIAIVLQALIGMTRTAVKSRMLAILAIAALALSAWRVHELIVLFGAGVVSMAIARLLARGERGRGHTVASALFAFPLALPATTAAAFAGMASTGTAGVGATMAGVGAASSRALSVGVASAGAIGAAAAAAGAAAAPVSLTSLFLFFLKVGSVLFGSGYVLLAFLRADLVERWGWLTNAQLLDAIAIGQVTPGPVFTTATFVGYVLAGPIGGVVATVGIFLPAFVFVALSGPLVPRLRRSAAAGAFLDGVVVASLALMALVTLELAGSALIDPLTIGAAIVSGVLLLRWRINSAWLVLGGAILGLVFSRF